MRRRGVRGVFAERKKRVCKLLILWDRIWWGMPPPVFLSKSAQAFENKGREV
jgi:hypothetical protein